MSALNVSLKQIAVSMNLAGVIGSGDQLLFSSPADLNRFAVFTDGTALIVGRVTAQQMINAGMRVSKRRPMVVISKSGVLENTTPNDDRWIYYAPDLPKAGLLAKSLENDLGLNGYTIAGGKQVYDEYLDLIDKGLQRPNNVYIFSHEVTEPTVSVKLSRDENQIVALLKSRMADPKLDYIDGDVVGKDSAGMVCRSTGGRFRYIFDAEQIDPTQVRKVGASLRVAIDGGEVCIDTDCIAGWNRKPGLELIEMLMTSGEKIAIRPLNRAGLNSLVFALNIASMN